ncbi:glycosyltransferase family 61 protein [Gluconacetobacter johannae]|uniref:Glycosyltransferase family 61 protein n=2 Tax=Gluconacetobacter johannae TaxID=112140 RepID=A0A7W4J591_9PROT|nr:glycosyltransferase family 61 protein [Gluconacetobacter johannae]
MFPAFLRHSHRAERSGPDLIGIADVADSVTCLEICPVQRARFAGGDAMRDRATNPFSTWSSMPVAVTLHHLRDVVYDVDHRVLLKDGCLIAETCYLQPAEALARIAVHPARLGRLAGPGVAIPCSDHWPGNYYHWMTHTLPVIAAVSDLLWSDLPTSGLPHGGPARLLLPPLLPWQRRTLDLLRPGRCGIEPIVPGAQYRVDRVAYCNIVAGAADFAMSRLCGSVFQRMAAAVPATRRPGVRLYVNRGGTGNRAIPNEGALAARLHDMGFLAVRPETLTPEAQIDLFRAASMVVGPLGAGMTNIGFCRPGTVVYDLVPDHHANPCFLAMAMHGNLAYWADRFPTGADRQDHVANWAHGIDVGQVARRVAELMPA